MSDDARKVLIVEDDKDLQTAYSMVISSQGYDVQVAGDGLEGLNILKSFVPDLILLDYFMPRMDGRTFLQNFDQSVYPGVKIVVASNISDQAVIDDLLSLGAHRYILKADVSPTELLQLVGSLIEPAAG